MMINQNLRRASIAMLGIGCVLIAGAIALFWLSRTPEYGWFLLSCGVIFLLGAAVFWSIKGLPTE
jgi:hypothetical protein